MIVVDTNIIVYLKLQSGKSEMAAQAYQKDPDWRVPLLWRSEFVNMLALYLRKGILSLSDAQRILDDALSLVSSEYQVAPERILELVSKSFCSAYDCEYVALAQELGAKLVTEDRQILEQFPETALSLVQFCEIV